MERTDTEIVNELDKKVMELNSLISEANRSSIEVDLIKLSVGTMGTSIDSFLYRLDARKKLTSSYTVGTG